MRNNSNYYSKLDPLCCQVCKEPECRSPKTCGEIAKLEWDKYIAEEKCKPEEFEPFNPCDYDSNIIYFMQYRSPHAVYNVYSKIFDNSFDNTFE